VKHYIFVDYATQVYSALVLLLILLFHNHTVPHWALLSGAHVLGLVLVHGIIQWQARSRGNKALDLLRHYYPILLYTGFFCETGHLNRMFFKDYLDPMVIRWDQALFGCQPGVIFMNKLPWLAVSELFYAAYFSYYLMIGGTGLALLLRNRQQFLHFVSVVSFVFYLCYLVYIFLPVVGPQVLIGDSQGYVLPASLQRLASEDAYPEGVSRGPFFQIMAWIYRVFESPGAAFPSSHVAVALCTVYFSFRYLRPIRFCHLGLAIILCLSTVYCHYHYGVDVLGGVITVAILVPLGNWLYGKFGNLRPKSEIRETIAAGRP
jgi:membrane-associated phospholipid phosphatase